MAAQTFTISLRTIRLPEQSLIILRTATVGALKAAITQSFPGAPTAEQQRLIFAGRLLGDLSEPLERVFLNQDATLPLAVHLVVSAVAPPAYSQGIGQAAGAVPLAQPPAWQQYPGNVRMNVQMGARAAPIAQQAPQPAQPQNPNQQPNRGGHSISLIIKLAFFVFIFTQGSSLKRKIIFGAIALVLYLYNIGKLRIVAHVHIHHNRPQQVHPQAQQQGQQPQAAGQQPQDQAAAPASPQPSLESILAAFLLSIIPSWQPPAAPVPPPPAAAAAA